jgi:hypothetical protein
MPRGGCARFEGKAGNAPTRGQRPKRHLPASRGSIGANLVRINSIYKISRGFEDLQRTLAADEEYRRAIGVLHVLHHASNTVNIDEIAL